VGRLAEPTLCVCRSMITMLSTGLQSNGILPEPRFAATGPRSLTREVYWFNRDHIG
jgi:hypothetical protein